MKFTRPLRANGALVASAVQIGLSDVHERDTVVQASRRKTREGTVMAT